MKGSQGKTTAVDQSDQYRLALTMDENVTEEIRYSEDDGWPPITVTTGEPGQTNGETRNGNEWPKCE